MKKRKITFSIIFFSALVAVCVFLYVFRSNVWAEMDNLKLIPIPEKFTELYFNDYSTLPKKSVAKELISFSFTIHNMEGATITYPYDVYFKYPDGSRVMFASGTTTIGDGDYQIINASHTWISSNLQGQVVAELTQKNQAIDFILPNNN